MIKKIKKYVNPWALFMEKIKNLNQNRKSEQKDYILSEDGLFLIKRNNIGSADSLFYTSLNSAVKECIEYRRKTFTESVNTDVEDVMAEVNEDNFGFIKMTETKTFVEELFDLIDKMGISDVECYKRAGIDRKLFSKIKKNVFYHPSSRTVIMLIFGLKLNLEEAENLMSKAGHSFTDWDIEDVIVKHFIKNEIYNTYLLDETLEHYGISPIFSK